jgi:hypothetical protein
MIFQRFKFIKVPDFGVSPNVTVSPGIWPA